MLSFPEDWDCSLKGLCAISKESRDGIMSILNELKEEHIEFFKSIDNNFNENTKVLFEVFEVVL